MTSPDQIWHSVIYKLKLVRIQAATGKSKSTIKRWVQEPMCLRRLEDIKTVAQMEFYQLGTREVAHLAVHELFDDDDEGSPLAVANNAKAVLTDMGDVIGAIAQQPDFIKHTPSCVNHYKLVKQELTNLAKTIRTYLNSYELALGIRYSWARRIGALIQVVLISASIALASLPLPDVSDTQQTIARPRRGKRDTDHPISLLIEA